MSFSIRKPQLNFRYQTRICYEKKKSNLIIYLEKVISDSGIIEIFIRMTLYCKIILFYFGK